MATKKRDTQFDNIAEQKDGPVAESLEPQRGTPPEGTQDIDQSWDAPDDSLLQAVKAVWEIPDDPKPRRLRTWRTFQGAVTEEKAIIPGVYWEDDPFLVGLVDFLVTQGYGEWLE